MVLDYIILLSQYLPKQLILASLLKGLPLSSYWSQHCEEV